jgi:hypothetical protein
MARMLAVWDRIPGLDETLARIAAIGPQDIRAFAERLVGRAAPAVALLGPVRRAPTLASLAGRLAA